MNSDTLAHAASQFLKQGRVDDAISTFREYVENLRQEYGEDHPESVLALRYCGLMLGGNEQYAAAEPFLNEYLDKLLGYLKGCNKYSCEARFLLGRCLFKNGKFTESTKVFMELMDDQDLYFEKKDPARIRNIAHYLEVLLASHQWERATDVWKDCLKLAASIDDDESMDDDKSKKAKIELLRASSCLLRYGHCTAGSKLIYQLLSTQQQQDEKRGQEQSSKHGEINEIATAAFQLMGEKALIKTKPALKIECVLILKERWGIIKRLLGECHPETIAALELLVDVAWKLGPDDGLLALFRHVYEARNRELGPSHAYTISAREKLRSCMTKLHCPEVQFLENGSANTTPLTGSHVTDVATVDVHSQVVAHGETKKEPYTTEHNEDYGAHQNASCAFCRELNVASNLTAAIAIVDHDEISYPVRHRSVGSLLAHRDVCPLCRLAINGFETKGLPLSELEQNAQITYEYCWQSEQHSELDVDFGNQSHLLLVVPFMQISVQTSTRKQKGQTEYLWLHALAPSSVNDKDCAARIKSVGEVDLRLTPGNSKKSMPYDARNFESDFSAFMKPRIDEIHGILAPLGDKYGYLKGRVVGESANIDLLKTWLHYCANHHGEECDPITYVEHGKAWRPSWLIDVHQDMLVPGSGTGSDFGGRYAALSYVWGDTSVSQLKHERKGGVAERIKAPRGLANDGQDRPPQTVQDAMELCRRMDIPYLWVDAICLDQDNIDDRDLKDMSKIFQGAYMTIVAAYGSDSHAGLPGITSRRSQQGQHTVEQVVDGHAFGLYRGTTRSILSRTKWITRAWTFQEMMLSKRLMFFTESEVIYQCSSGMSWRESVFLEHPQLSKVSFSAPFAECNNIQLFKVIGTGSRPRNKKKDADFAFAMCRGLLHNYLHRQSTKQSDTLKALQGIATAVEENTGMHLFHGIFVGPSAFRSLLFTTSGPPSKHRRHGFPSWSWCGWQGMPIVDDARPGFKFLEDHMCNWFGPTTQLYWMDKEDKKIHQDHTGASRDVFVFCAMENDRRAFYDDTAESVMKDVFLAEREEYARKISRLWKPGTPGDQGKEEGKEQKKEEENVPGILRINGADMTEDWKKQAENMLIFSAETLRITVSQDSTPIPWHAGMRRHRIATPPSLHLGLGFQGIDMDETWKETKNCLELVAFAEAKAFDERDATKVGGSVRIGENEDGGDTRYVTAYLPRIGYAGHLVARVAVLLVETDCTTGISERLGLYDVEKECWDLADGKCERRVYLC